MMRESEIKFSGLTIVEVEKRFAGWRRNNPDAVIIDRGRIKRLPQLPLGGRATGWQGHGPNRIFDDRDVQIRAKVGPAPEVSSECAFPPLQPET